MTLSALFIADEKKLLFNPSVLIASGADRDRIVRQSREQQADGLFCPHCYYRTGELHPVRFRNVEDKRVHFFHVRDGDGQTECANYRGESEKHLAAKAAIAHSLEQQGAMVEVDMQWVEGEQTRRKPDILATYPNGAIVAHEVQISRIAADSIVERTSDIRAAGVQSVAWYLYGKNYSRENRERCQRSSIPVWKLAFEGSDANPIWTPDVGIKKQAETRTAVVGKDVCAKPAVETAWQQNKPTEPEAWVPLTQELAVVGSIVRVSSANHPKHGWTGTIVALPWGVPGMVDVSFNDLLPGGKHDRCYGKRWNDEGEHCGCGGWHGGNPSRQAIGVLETVQNLQG